MRRRRDVPAAQPSRSGCRRRRPGADPSRARPSRPRDRAGLFSEHRPDGVDFLACHVSSPLRSIVIMSPGVRLIRWPLEKAPAGSPRRPLPPKRCAAHRGARGAVIPSKECRSRLAQGSIMNSIMSATYVHRPDRLGRARNTALVFFGDQGRSDSGAFDNALRVSSLQPVASRSSKRVRARCKCSRPASAFDFNRKRP
jgi:hypothetical protein